ncbi:hypothetical protein GCM10009863_62270 [Streptomyces axinellae]|uniref:Uncharacterized protein n=1 Tax=Streptomyces axinellae TaxID=552788 RepID=A0ABN3QXA8_9ACTN
MARIVLPPSAGAQRRADTLRQSPDRPIPGTGGTGRVRACPTDTGPLFARDSARSARESARAGPHPAETPRSPLVSRRCPVRALPSAGAFALGTRFPAPFCGTPIRRAPGLRAQRPKSGPE